MSTDAKAMRVTGAVQVLVDHTTTRTGDLHIQRGSVAPDAVPGAEVVDVSGCVVTPGLVNAHHHLLQSAFRTLPGTRGVPMSQWLQQMAAAYQRVGITPELCAAAAGVGLAEGLLNGVTTVADHQLNWPPDPAPQATVEIATAIVQQSRSLGSRLVFVRGSARDDPKNAARSAVAITEALVPQGGLCTDGMLQIAVGPAGAHSDTEETFRLMGEVAAQFGLRRRTQSNEQVDVTIALEKYGKRPLQLLADWGWLDTDVTLAHLCDVTEQEIAMLGECGVSATHAPGCDVPMGWGIAPVAALQKAGVPVGLGTSGGGSNDAGHVLADARLAMQVSALRGSQLPARDVLSMATEGGAVGLGRPELGHLRSGAAADFCVWDVSGVADAGVEDPVAGLLWANPGRRPRDVVVGGRFAVRNYQLVHGEERALASSLHQVVGR